MLVLQLLVLVCFTLLGFELAGAGSWRLEATRSLGGSRCSRRSEIQGLLRLAQLLLLISFLFALLLLLAH